MNKLEAAKLLETETRAQLFFLDNAEGLKKLILEELIRDKRGVIVEDGPRLPFLLLPMTVCHSICGDYRRALPAAAAIQFFMAAGDILDDIEDNDSDSSLCHKYGASIATNAATALIILAEKTLSQLKEYGTPPAIVNQVLAVANSYYLKACCGQHLDLSLAPAKFTSEKQYLKIAAMKSATSIQNACHIGALLGGARPRTVLRFAKFGFYLGMSAQMNNDLKGLATLKDIRAGKITLPIVYALKRADNSNKSKLKEYYVNSSRNKLTAEDIIQILKMCGAIYYTIVKAEYFKQRAQEILDIICTPGIPAQEFESLLK